MEMILHEEHEQVFFMIYILGNKPTKLTAHDKYLLQTLVVASKTSCGQETDGQRASNKCRVE